MKEARILCVYEKVHVLEVPDDFCLPETLDDFTDEQLRLLKDHDQVQLVDWWDYISLPGDTVEDVPVESQEV